MCHSQRGFFRYLLTSVLALSVSPILSSAEVSNITARRTSEKIQLDGLLSESSWQGNPAIEDFVQVEPRSGEKPTEATNVWVAFSDNSLYIAVRCRDSSVRQIVTTDMGRDTELGENDKIEIVLDTYHDHRNAYYFATNAAGALVDGRVTENQEPALEWDGVWNVRTRIDEHGWTAEFEIPFKTFGFNLGLPNEGYNISRHLARGRETSRWASPSLDVKLNQTVKAGQISGLEGLSQGVGLDVKPYGLVGFTRDIERADVSQGTGKGGVDIFYRITSNLVSSTTINTDFAETEVDTRQINLTRFPLFFPEKRGFFLEDAGIFEFVRFGEEQGPPGMQSGGDLIPFFSRRIGLVEGAEIPLLVGEKVTGKIGRFDVGILGTRTGDLTRDKVTLVPAKNLAVGRVKANFLSQSYVGALFTSGDPTGETTNQVGAIDLKLATSDFLKSEKNLSLVLFGSKSRTTGLKGRDTSYGGTLAFPNDLVNAQYKWMKIGENYNPELGFVPRRGVRISALSAEFSPRPKFWTIRQMSFEFEYSDYFNMREHSSETREFKVTPFQWMFNSGERINYEYSHNMERLYEPWEIEDGIVLPSGQYTFGSHQMEFSSSETRPIAAGIGFSTGSFFGGTRREVSAETIWRKSRHLTAAFSLERNWLSLKQGDFTTTLVTGRLDYSFTPFITLANYVQYDTESRDIGLQSRLRWILMPGTDFYVVVNHAWREDEFDRFESAQTRFQIKLNYTFRF